MDLRTRIERAINACSAENGSNTPDFILAGYIMDCLAAFDRATERREGWYGRLKRASVTGPKEFIGPSCLWCRGKHLGVTCEHRPYGD